jgi:hypothetical protein
VSYVANDRSRRFSTYEKVLILLFMLTLPLSNPWVRGDGVGYYAFARALLIEHRLDFTRDWLQANTSFQMGRIDEAGRIRPEQYTVTGHLDNHFAVGPAILWLPGLLMAHAGVLLYDRFGGNVPADGYSKPYLVAMSVFTAVYGFLALLLAFRVARQYVREQWAFLATLGIWLGSSLPVYMYLNPAWAHAPSAFSVALFLWYWNRTRVTRTLTEWLALGSFAGLMIDMYYLNVAILVFPAADILRLFRNRPKQERNGSFLRVIILKCAVFMGMAFVTFVPTLVTKKIIYGSYWNFGYVERWFWNSPAILKVCFSSEHGVFTWTPILIAAVAGLFLLRRTDAGLATRSMLGFGIFLYLLGCYEDWHGISSFGSRFFVSLTPLFVIGLAAFFDFVSSRMSDRRALTFAGGITSIFVLWNAGLMFQWGTHLIPSRGPISWSSAAYNQVAIVPEQAAGVMKAYLTGRNALMDRIEQEDVEQLKSETDSGAK